MERDEMTAEQMRRRGLIINTLRAAGWQETGERDLFEQGYSIPFEAEMRRWNGSLDLVVKYAAVAEALYFSALGPEEAEFRLRILFGDNLKQLLEIIVRNQNRLAPGRTADAVREIVRLCPDTFAIFEDADDFVRVVE